MRTSGSLATILSTVSRKRAVSGSVTSFSGQRYQLCPRFWKQPATSCSRFMWLLAVRPLIFFTTLSNLFTPFSYNSWASFPLAGRRHPSCSAASAARRRIKRILAWYFVIETAVRILKEIHRYMPEHILKRPKTQHNIPSLADEIYVDVFRFYWVIYRGETCTR